MQAKKPAALAHVRAFCARNRVTWAEIARALGLSRSYICHVMHSDTRAKSISAAQMDRICTAAMELAWKKEQ